MTAEPGASQPLATPGQIRAACRRGDQTGPTAGLAPGFTQANLVVLAADWAYDFLLFCVRNPRPCPLLDVTDPGGADPGELAPGADLRTDLPRYRVFRDGRLIEEPAEVTAWWRDDLVAFLLGCSFGFEAALAAAGIPLRHVDLGVNVPMYRTRRRCRPAGRLRSELVVSMRPMLPEQAVTAARISGRYPLAHGSPIHAGDPEVLGITDLSRPDFGDPVSLRPGEIPVFWACGVTPQLALEAARPPLAITHAPGHMLVCDRPVEESRD